jgi:CMP-N,N'-diacetyllegionaminic acid synthase
MFENILFIIPARGGSKGVPKKNVKLFLGKPLIHYSIEYARLFVPDSNICVSTDDDEIIACIRQIGIDVPFIRPNNLATDTSDTFSVLQHALNHYLLNENRQFEGVVLLQPTSPMRERKHLEEAIKLWNKETEMVVSVSEAESSPYFTLFEEDNNGFLKICMGDGSFTRRQDAPTIYEYNGSIYIIRSDILQLKNSFKEITKKIKYVMDCHYSIDIDTIDDWNYAEYKYAKINEKY